MLFLMVKVTIAECECMIDDFVKNDVCEDLSMHFDVILL